MKSCSLHHWILFFIILMPVSPQTHTSVIAKFHHPAILPCCQICSGVMTWKMFNNTDVLARCDQLSCQSQEGFNISHDQYLNGNLTLIIKSVDYSNNTIFTCYCDDNPVSDVCLIIEALVSQIQKKPGEDLVLDLLIPEPIEVDYKSKYAIGSKSESICFVFYGSLQCETNYTQRVSLSHTELTLRDLKVSDSGVYIIRDIKNEEIIHTYMVSVEAPVTSVTVKFNQPANLTCNQKCSGVMTWKTSDGYILARCDQFTCSSEEEFKISHDQYLNGNLDLVIRSVDYSKRTIYTCYCDDKALCNIFLIIEPLVSAVQKKPGEDLVLGLSNIPEPMELFYKRKDTTDHDGELICNVTAGSLQCRTDYKQRASLNHTELTLRELKVSDSGVYIIRDMKNKADIHMYAVFVEDCQPGDQTSCISWKLGVVVLVVILLLFVIGLMFIYRKNLMPFFSQVQNNAHESEQSLVRSNGDISQRANHTSGSERE